MPADIELEIPTKDATICAFMLWHALSQALAEIGRLRGDDGWKERLFDEIMLSFDNSEVEQTGDQTHFERSGINTSRSAQKSGEDLIGAAFDRIKFSNTTRG